MSKFVIEIFDDDFSKVYVLGLPKVSRVCFLRSYLTRDRWLELWQEATGDYSITQVDIRKFKKHVKDSEVHEIAKYSAKDNDYLQSEEVFDVFYKALKGKRILVYSGLFKDANKKLKNGDLKEYMKEDTTEYVYLILYTWGEKSTYSVRFKRFLRTIFNRN